MENFDCPNCGPNGCYNICPNSRHYYSVERERQDDMLDDGADDIRERYADGELDYSEDAYERDMLERELDMLTDDEYEYYDWRELDK